MELNRLNLQVIRLGVHRRAPGPVTFVGSIKSSSRDGENRPCAHDAGLRKVDTFV